MHELYRYDRSLNIPLHCICQQIVGLDNFHITLKINKNKNRASSSKRRKHSSNSIFHRVVLKRNFQNNFQKRGFFDSKNILEGTISLYILIKRSNMPEQIKVIFDRSYFVILSPARAIRVSEGHLKSILKPHLIIFLFFTARNAKSVS